MRTKKYDIDAIYSTRNQIKITTEQSGSKAMIREKGQDKATIRQGFRVFADDECIKMGQWDKSERDLLLDTIKTEYYAKQAYKEAYYDLLQKIRSIGFVPEEENENDVRF